MLGKKWLSLALLKRHIVALRADLMVFKGTLNAELWFRGRQMRHDGFLLQNVGRLAIKRLAHTSYQSEILKCRTYVCTFKLTYIHMCKYVYVSTRIYIALHIHAYIVYYSWRIQTLADVFWQKVVRRNSKWCLSVGLLFIAVACPGIDYLTTYIPLSLCLPPSPSTKSKSHSQSTNAFKNSISLYFLWPVAKHKSSPRLELKRSSVSLLNARLTIYIIYTHIYLSGFLFFLRINTSSMWTFKLNKKCINYFSRLDFPDFGLHLVIPQRIV